VCDDGLVSGVVPSSQLESLFSFSVLALSSSSFSSSSSPAAVAAGTERQPVDNDVFSSNSNNGGDYNASDNSALPPQESSCCSVFTGCSSPSSSSPNMAAKTPPAVLVSPSFPFFFVARPFSQASPTSVDAVFTFTDSPPSGGGDRPKILNSSIAKRVILNTLSIPLGSDEKQRVYEN
jgi:hypothetical protein